MQFIRFQTSLDGEHMEAHYQTPSGYVLKMHLQRETVDILKRALANELSMVRGWLEKEVVPMTSDAGQIGN